MSRDELLNNLDFATNLAKAGAKAPLLGGPIGLMWSCLSVPALLLHGAAMSGAVNYPQDRIGLIWMIFGIVGGIGSFILGRKIDGKAGAGTTANRLSGALWLSATILIFTYAITTAIAFGMNKVAISQFDTIITFAFAMHAVALGVIGHMTGLTYQRIAGGLAGAFMVISLLLIGNPALYALAALGVVFVGIIPSLIEIRNEKTNG